MTTTNTHHTHTQQGELGLSKQQLKVSGDHTRSCVEKDEKSLISLACERSIPVS